MATLNTLRTKGGIIVSILIGLALVAFLLSDLTSSGSRILGERKMRVGEINDTHIGYNEYLTKAEYMTTVSQIMAGTDNLPADQVDRARDLAWESLIMKYAYLPGFEKMGISPGDAEQSDMVSGAYISPIVSGTFSNQSTGIFDPELLRNFVVNADADQTGRTAMMWEYLKEQMLNQRTMNKYMALISKGIFVNNLEIENGMKGSGNTYAARYISLPYSSIADSTVSVSSSDIKKYYNQNKKMFHQNESRDIEYILFEMAPSKEDFQAALLRIGELSSEFAVTESPLQYAAANSTQTSVAGYVKIESLDPAIAAVVAGKDKSAIYGPVLQGNTYTMARLADTRSLPDSIGARHILVEATKKDLADSLVAALKGGANFTALAAQYSLDKNTPEGDFGRFDPSYMIPQISEACYNAKVGEIMIVPTNYGLHIVNLTYKSAPILKYQVATITYKVDPSSETEQIIYGQASSFLSSVAADPKKFDQVAATSSLPKRTAHITNMDHNVNGIENSRELVRWSFNTKEGGVSNIMEINDNYVVAVVTGVREYGNAPIKQVAGNLKSLLAQKEKFKTLSAKMQGASLDSVSSAIGVEISVVNDLQPSAFYIDGAGVEQQLIGAICSSDKGKLSKAVEGASGVYLFEVTAITNGEAATLQDEKVRQQTVAQSYLMERLNMGLMQQSKVKDVRVKFF